MSNVLLSIIIPVYNVEKYVGKTLSSIALQLNIYSDVEVLIVNDGTPDHSMEIVASYAETVPNIQVINQENGGLSCARNTGLNSAKGKYIWFVDSDDWLAENSIKKIKEDLLDDKFQTDVFCYQIKEVTEDNKVLFVRSLYTDTKRYIQGSEFVLSRVSFAPMQQYVIRKSFLIDNKLYFKEKLVHEDIELAPKMLLLANRVCLVPFISYCYLRRNDGNITGSKEITTNRLNSLKMILAEYIDLESKTTDKIAKICFRKIQKTAVFAIYSFSSMSQIRSNFSGAFDKEHHNLYKRVILNNILSLNYSRLLYLTFDLLFLISPKLYKHVCVMLAK